MTTHTALASKAINKAMVSAMSKSHCLMAASLDYEQLSNCSTWP